MGDTMVYISWYPKGSATSVEIGGMDSLAEAAMGGSVGQMV